MTIQEKILAIIAITPMTAKELAVKFNASYDWIAKVMKGLVEDGQVKYVSERSGKSSYIRRYSVGTIKTEEISLPRGFKRCGVMSGRWV